MSNPPYPLMADPSDPGIGRDDDVVEQAALGHGDSVTTLGSEVGETSDDDVNHWIISSATVDRATENLRAQDPADPDGPAGS